MSVRSVVGRSLVMGAWEGMICLVVTAVVLPASSPPGVPAVEER